MRQMCPTPAVCSPLYFELWTDVSSVFDSLLTTQQMTADAVDPC